MPLLPASNTFLAHLENDLKHSTDRGMYKPLHEIDEQPKLIVGGLLKDYQVSRIVCMIQAMTFTVVLVAWPFISCVDV